MNGIFFGYWIVTEDSRGEDHEVVTCGTWGTFPDNNGPIGEK